MASSLRRKIRDNGKRMVSLVDLQIECLAKISIIADGQSDFINSMEKPLLEYLEGSKRTCQEFLDRL